MTVYRDGKVLKTIPISSGAPEHTTYNGKMVISEKYIKTRMNGDTVGFGGEYDIKDVPHAMRLTNSGTFIHGNYWAAASVFGSQQHQPRLRRPARRARRAATRRPRPPGSTTTRSSATSSRWSTPTTRPSSRYNGLNGWNMPWSEWTA